jgi:hypothetical protein
MNELDRFYIKLLWVGFLVLRHAIDSKNQSWINAEYQLLHNIPSLIGEQNLRRHRYFWEKERMAYINWMSASGGESMLSDMRTFHEPAWEEMASTIEGVIRQVDSADSSN